MFLGREMLRILNAPGNGVADDKGIYYFVPKMIQYYLGKNELTREIYRMIPRVERSGLEYDKEKLKKMRGLVGEEVIDYYKIVAEVESIF
jgi:uncharacterized circularly permuted ATP-grasp superfamily protein